MTRSIKVRLQPTKEQIELFKQWFGCARHTYNWALHLVQQQGRFPDWQQIRNRVSVVKDGSKGRQENRQVHHKTDADMEPLQVPPDPTE